MRLISVPSSLKKSLLAIWLIPLFFLVQAIFYYKTPWWKLEWSFFEPWLIPILSLTCFFWLALMRGKKIFIPFLSLFALLWVSFSTILIFKSKNALFSFSCISIGLFWYFFLDHLKMVFSLPYLYSGKTWYQSTPEVISGLRGTFKLGDLLIHQAKISQISRGGVFLLLDPPLKKTELSKKLPHECQITLQFKGEQITHDAQLISCASRHSSLKEGTEIYGFGLQFNNKALDAAKELSDLIESLRGEGHVV